jgi:hypothetical protein
LVGSGTVVARVDDIIHFSNDQNETEIQIGRAAVTAAAAIIAALWLPKERDPRFAIHIQSSSYHFSMAIDMSDLGKKPNETGKVEKTAEKIGVWAMRICISLIHIGVAYEIVQIAEGDLQTIVVCILGLMYCGLRVMSAEAEVNAYCMGYMLSQIAVYQSSEPERKMEDKLAEMTTALGRGSFDPQRRYRWIESWILNLVFGIPLLKICFTHLLA